MGGDICRRRRCRLAGAYAAHAWRRIRPHLNLSWENQGLAAGTVGIAAIAWLTFTQIVASGMGGYPAGRLRTKWVDTHTNEIYFRDTAHGFLTWAVALLVSAVLLTTTISSLIGGSAKVIGSVAGARRQPP
jgi:hypothetical protein